MDVILVLGLEEFNEVMVKGLVSLLNVNTLLRLGIDHPKVELIRVSKGGLGFEDGNGLGFLVKVLGSENVVLVLFQESPFGAIRWLRSLLVRLALDGISIISCVRMDSYQKQGNWLPERGHGYGLGSGI